MPGDCRFDDNCSRNEAYARWISRTSDAHKARCTLCLRDIDISIMGESALKSRAKSGKHKRLVDGGIKIKVSELLCAHK